MSNLTKTPPRMTRTVESNQEVVAWTLDALRSVWVHQQDRVNERIDAIERAIVALSEDRPNTDLKRDAERAAHMLAGSLGMFGFIDASEAARELEHELPHATPDRAAALAALLQRLRSGVRGPVAMHAQAPTHAAAPADCH